jgi:hypothetical protein
VEAKKKLGALAIGCAVTAMSLSSISPAHAASITATDGDSQVSIRTPIVAPSTSTCTKVPYTYEITDDVHVATTVIVDANGQLVARGNELIAGSGTDELNVCGVNLSGTTPPFNLAVQLSYTPDSGLSNTTVRSSTFSFTPRTVKCRKARQPHRGRIRQFTTARCPAGWLLVRR